MRKSLLDVRLCIHWDVEFEWDPPKAEANHKKHGVRFSDALAVLYDPLALTILDDHPEEERCVTVGEDATGRVLVVVYTWRGTRVRLISARKASKREREQYEETK